VENPAVWLLRRGFTLDWLRSVDTGMLSRLRELERALQAGDKERAQAIAEQIALHLRLPPFPQRFWGANDYKIVLWLSSLALLGVVVYQLSGGIFLNALQGKTFLLIVLFSFANLLPFVYTSLLSLLQREHTQGTAVFLRLTRLSGRRLLEGAIGAYALAGSTRLFLVWGAPTLIPVGFLVYDSAETATLVFVRAGLCITAMGMLWQTFLGLCAVRRPTLLWQIATTTVVIVAAVMAWLGAVAAVGALVEAGWLQAFKSTPVWLWVVQPVFWMSVLFPPLCVLLCPEILHPLWGVLQTLIWLAVVRALMPLSARRLQHMLNAPEPELKPQEGAWW
jgi:hypothetical protein